MLNKKFSLLIQANRGIILNLLICNLFLLIKGKNQITLKFKADQASDFNILNKEFYTDPLEVIINSVSKPTCKKSCAFSLGYSTVIIKFNSQLNSCLNMFNGTSQIIEVDLSQFDASKVTTMENMFMDCQNLEKVTFGSVVTSSVQNMNLLFLRCYKLSSIDLPNLDTSAVTTMRDMFSHCQKMTSLDLSNFNTAKVEDMYDLFCECHSLSSLDLSKFKTGKVKNMRGMFYNDYNLK